ncbi:MAG TPA: hypothetical protein PKH10_12315, partial [bacterium]|nr:hypothetical protein [bacterium]
MRNAGRWFIALSVMLISGMLCAKSLSIFPTAWKKAGDRSFAESLDENFLLMLEKVKGVDASGADALSSDIKKQVKKCGGKIACIERAAKAQTDADLAAILAYGGGRIEVTIFNKKGKKVGESAVDVAEDDEPEDVVGGLLGSINKLLSKVQDDTDDGGSSSSSTDEEDSSSASSGPAKSLSASEKKEVRRKGFKAYQGADYKGAVSSFRTADDTELADMTEDINKLLGKAKDAVQSQD